MARQVYALLRKRGLRPAALLEPTCGLGNFLLAGLDQFSEAKAAIGHDINNQHITHATAILNGRPDHSRGRLVAADFFDTAWETIIGELPQPVLVLGNLPWVTNADLGAGQS